VRAVTHPYPGAFCFIGGRKLLIWAARIGSESGSHGQVGRDLRRTSRWIVEVAAGEGSVILGRVQLEDGVEASPREALAHCGAGGTLTREAAPGILRLD
jgi:methionyl-tRNA formyltransferase